MTEFTQNPKLPLQCRGWVYRVPGWGDVPLPRGLFLVEGRAKWGVRHLQEALAGCRITYLPTVLGAQFSFSP